MCKVQKCHDKHPKHFCCICQNQDSDHFAFNCPHSSVAYYGISREISQMIKQHGFHSSKKGKVNQTIYFNASKEEAIERAKKKYNNLDIVVIQCKIPSNKHAKQNFFILPTDSNQTIKQKLFQWYSKIRAQNQGYQMVPWESKVYCVKSSKNIKVVKFHDKE